MNLQITDNVIKKVSELIAEEENADLYLRVFVQGGGCSGMQYGFTFDEIANDDDFHINAGSIRVLIDSISSQYLTEATIDYSEDIYGASFTIKNPNAETTCGCGSSFSPKY